MSALTGLPLTVIASETATFSSFGTVRRASLIRLSREATRIRCDGWARNGRAVQRARPKLRRLRATWPTRLTAASARMRRDDIGGAHRCRSAPRSASTAPPRDRLPRNRSRTSTINWRSRCSYASACSSSATQQVGLRARPGFRGRWHQERLATYCARFSMSSSDSVLVDARHVAGIVGAPLRLEVRELLLDVFVVLPRDARNFVLADEIAAVAHRAQHLVGLASAGRNLGRIRLEAGGRLLLLREVIGERQHVARSSVAAIGLINGSLRRPSLKSLSSR